MEYPKKAEGIPNNCRELFPPPDTMIVAFVLAFLIFINAFFVAAEFSSVSARRTRIYQLAAEGNRWALLLEPVLTDSHKLDTYVATCQVGITASSLVLGFYGQSQLAGYLSPMFVRFGGLQDAAAESVAATVVLLVLTTLQVLLGELVPKSIGVRFPERLALVTIAPMRWAEVLLSPFTWLLNGTGRLLLRMLKVSPLAEHGHVHEPGEIELLVAESAEGGQIDAKEKAMLRNVFRLSGLVARQVMIPRPRIEAAPADISPWALLEQLADSPFTRIPIYRDTIDHIVGFIHMKDLFRVCFASKDQVEDLDLFLREVLFVPETMPAEELWTALKVGHHYMAIVFDEYGGTAGIVTQEDLIEEIFGELQDEFDQEGPLIAYGDDEDVVLRGDVLVSDVNEYLLLNLPLDQADTIGGLVTSQLGRPAKPGDQVQIGAHLVRVRQVDDLAVTQVSLTLPDDIEPMLDGEHAQ